MRTEVLKQLLDACHLAKKSIETMPKLPKGMKPRHVHVMDVKMCIRDRRQGIH